MWTIRKCQLLEIVDFPKLLTSRKCRLVENVKIILTSRKVLIGKVFNFVPKSILLWPSQNFEIREFYLGIEPEDQSAFELRLVTRGPIRMREF